MTKKSRTPTEVQCSNCNRIRDNVAPYRCPNCNSFTVSIDVPAASLAHTIWCLSNELALCTGCSVKKGWDRNGVTGGPTTCRDGKPHEWLPKPCNCGPNDRRRGDRRG